MQQLCFLAGILIGVVILIAVAKLSLTGQPTYRFNRADSLFSNPDYSRPGTVCYSVCYRNPKRKRGQVLVSSSLTLRVTIAP